MVVVIIPWVSTKQLGVSSAREDPRAVCSAFALDAEVEVMVDFELEERPNRFISGFYCEVLVSILILVLVYWQKCLFLKKRVEY